MLKLLNISGMSLKVFMVLLRMSGRRAIEEVVSKRKRCFEIRIRQNTRIKRNYNCSKYKMQSMVCQKHPAALLAYHYFNGTCKSKRTVSG